MKYFLIAIILNITILSLAHGAEPSDHDPANEIKQISPLKKIVRAKYAKPSAQGIWNYLEVQSGYEERDWDIYRTTATVSFSVGTFTVTYFCAVNQREEHCYKVKGTIKESTDIYGDDIVATFTPQDTGALPQSCKGKYVRRKSTNGVSEEMNFLCNGSNDFRSFKRFTRNEP